jgi:hypothetical protein
MPQPCLPGDRQTYVAGAKIVARVQKTINLWRHGSILWLCEPNDKLTGSCVCPGGDDDERLSAQELRLLDFFKRGADRGVRLYQFLRYAICAYRIHGLLSRVRDTRRNPSVPTSQVLISLLMAAVLRVPSINQLELMLSRGELQRLLGARTKRRTGKAPVQPIPSSMSLIASSCTPCRPRSLRSSRRRSATRPSATTPTAPSSAWLSTGGSPSARTVVTARRA